MVYNEKIDFSSLASLLDTRYKITAIKYNPSKST